MPKRAYDLEIMRAALADPATRIEALESLRELIERVTVKAQGEGFTIELVGEIARMVAMAAEAKNAKAASKEVALPDEFACSVKVVAGARNHLYRTRVTWIRRSVGG